MLAVSLIVFAGSNALTGASRSFVWLLAARGLGGLGASGVTPTVYAMVVASAPEGKQATWLSVARSGLLLALCSGAPAGSLAAQAVGWRAVFLVIAGMAALLLIASFVTTRNPRQEDPVGDNPGLIGRVATIDKVRAVSTTTLGAFAVYGV